MTKETNSFIAKYITNWESTDTGNKSSVSFEIFNTPVSISWLEVIDRKKLLGSSIVDQDTLHYAFPLFDNIDELHLEIKEHVNKVREFVPDLEWPTTAQDITQEYLNYLHKNFHEAEDKLHLPEYESFRTPSLMFSVEKINYLVHQLEKLVDAGSHRNETNYKLVNFGKHDGKYRNPITDDMRPWFGEFGRHVEKRTKLVLGYATIGKNLFHCMTDNDPTVVREGLLRPQLDIGGEALIVTRELEEFKSLTVDQAELRNSKTDERMEHFVNSHNLSSYVDWMRPEHRYGMNSLLGVISDEYDYMSPKDFYDIAKNYNLVDVEVIRYD